jgi:hypothetical protein
MVADLKGHTSFDFKVSPTGFDYLVAVLLTHDYEPLVMIRVPLAEVQRHCCASADGLRFRWTQDPLTAEWLTIYRPVTPE